MKFRTEVKIPEELDLIQYKDKIMSIGSCFAQNIGANLDLLGFRNKINPFGILFNPISIEKNILNAINKEFNEALIIERDYYFYHYDYHSNRIGETKSDLIKELKQQQAIFVNELKVTNRLVITFGTAWVYRLISQNEIVANCHKIPQKAFEKELLDLSELKKRYTHLIKKLRQESPNLEIILTVSPVRHVKNGLHENNLSKAILLLLSQFLADEFDFVRYFPSYELVIDDLRDYRFYERDLIHPNQQAIEYVFEHFKKAYFNYKTKEIAKLQYNYVRFKGHNSLVSSELQVKEKRKKEAQMQDQIEKLKAKT